MTTETPLMTFEAVAGQLRGDPRFGTAESGEASRILEALRTAFEASSDSHDRRAAFCTQVGAATDPRIRAALVDVREAFDRQSIALLVGEIDRLFARSEGEGWTAWLRAMAEAVVRFRHAYTTRLCAHPFPFAAARTPSVTDLRRAVQCMRQARWEEVDESVAFLSAQETAVTAQTRARLTVMRAQIELWRFVEKKRAAALLTEAERLAPDDVIVLVGSGDWHAQDGNGERAMAYYRRAIDVAPVEPNGYVGMGEWCEKEGAADKDERSREAEVWFRRAVEKAPGDATGFDRLIRLLVRTGAYRIDQTEVTSLLERRIAVDPEGEFDAYLALGDHCRDYCRERPVSDEARAWYRAQSRRWYERARSLQPDWPLGCPGLAELCKDEGDFDQAEREGQRTITLGPECPSGYLFLSAFYESRGRRDEALRIFEHFPERPHRWKLYANASVARLRAETGDYAGATSLLLDVLQEESASDREQVFAEGTLETIADDAYRKRGDTAMALEIFSAILKRRDAYRARYHHLVGNLFYYRSEYATAAEHYQLAIDESPREGAYHRYLAGALRGLSRFSEAQSELDKAFALDGDDRRRREESATLANTQANRAFEAGDFRTAIPFYTTAVELNPAEPVYQSNLALAWERVQEPGRRIEHLEQAVSWYGRAQQTAGDMRHEDRIQRLRRRVDLAREYGEEALNWFALVTPIAIEVAQDLVPVVSDHTATRLSVDLEREVEAMRLSVSNGLGITVPGIRFRGTERTLPGGTYIVSFDEVPIVSGVIAPIRRFCPGTAEELAGWSVSGEAALDPMTGAPGVWVAREQWDAATAAGAPLWTVTGYMMRHVEAIVRRSAAEFVGHQEVVNLLVKAPAAVRDAIRAAPGALSALTNVCRGLAAEGVPLVPFDALSTTFKTLSDDGIRPRDIVERVRLLPDVREQLPGRNGRAYLRTGETFEAEIRRSLYRKSDRIVLAMLADHCKDALQALRSRMTESGGRPLTLVVADPTLRPFVRKLVEAEFPDVPVLSAAEARDGVETLPGRVDLTTSPSPTTVDFKGPATVGLSDQREEPASAAEESSAGVVEIAVGAALRKQPSSADEGDLDKLLSLMRDGLFYELGMFVPRVEVHENDGLADGVFEVRIGGSPSIATTGLGPDEILINESPDRLSTLGLHGRAAVNPATGSACTIVHASPADLAVCRQAGLTVWGQAGFIVLRVSALLRRAAPALQTDVVTRHLIDSLALSFPDLVQAVLQRFPLPTIARVLRLLLAEEISIRNLRMILECLLLLDGSSDVDLNRLVFSANAEPLCFDPQARAVADLPARVLADHVRTGLKRYISNKYTAGGSTLSVYLLSSDIEQRLRRVPEQPLTSGELSRLVGAVQPELSRHSKSVRPVLLTNLDVRSTARAALQEAFPTLTVLCYQELTPELNISPVARINWQAS